MTAGDADNGDADVPPPPDVPSDAEVRESLEEDCAADPDDFAHHWGIDTEPTQN